MERERGFTLIELVVAVGITAILLLAGGVWMLGWHPGTLRNAADDFDAQLAAARAIAGTSGNGATIAFTPQRIGAGFVMRVYAGRPTASGAVTSTNVMTLSSTSSVTEATFGKPPFTIFLNSGGYPTGMSSYPNVAGDGSVSFPVIATQPPCPVRNIVLTLTNGQGVSTTRTLPCNAALSASGAGAPGASPTPNVPVVHPPFLLAHWTSDNAALHFIAAEFGYTHWFASMDGNACAVQRSGNGATPVTFASGWPYAQPNSPGETSLAPPAPNAPYSWPNGDPNDPPAPFQLSGTPGDGGLCTVRIQDDYGQEADALVQVMGDLTLLTPANTTITFATPTAAAQTLTFGKTFDAESLALQARASACAGVATVAIPAPASPQSSPSTTPATATLSIAPVAAGTCRLLVADQYGEPPLSLTIAVLAPTPPPLKPFNTWPGSLELPFAGGNLGATSGVLAFAPDAPLQTRVATLINAALGGGVARAASYGGSCYARSYQSGTGGAIDASAPAAVLSALAVSVTTDGCILNADGSGPYGATTPTGVMVAYEPVGSGQTGSFLAQPINCTAINLALGSWNPASASGAQALLPATGSAQGTCTVDFTDGQSTQTPAPDAGAVAVTVIPCSPDDHGYCAVAPNGVGGPTGGGGGIHYSCVVGGRPYSYEGVATPPGGVDSVDIYDGSYVDVKTFDLTEKWIIGPCGGYEFGGITWSPEDPGTYFNDPNLP